MKVTREMLTRAAIDLIDQVGLDDLTLRLLGKTMDIQAATIYWHFKDKQDLLNEMATLVLAEGSPDLHPKQNTSDWKRWMRAFGTGLRQTMLAHRDGARMIAGTRLTSTDYMAAVEVIAQQLIEAHFSLRRATVLLSTVYNYTLSFTLEEQAVFPTPGQRSPQYDLAARERWLTENDLPLLRRSGPILFDDYGRRYREGLDLIVRGADLTPR